MSVNAGGSRWCDGAGSVGSVERRVLRVQVSGPCTRRESTARSARSALDACERALSMLVPSRPGHVKAARLPQTSTQEVQDGPDDACEGDAQAARRRRQPHQTHKKEV